MGGESKKMKCPICKSDLILGEGFKRYQTLAEHVQDIEPDGKEYYICSNNNCLSNKEKWFWDSMGDFYGTGVFYKNYKLIELFDKKITSALSSPSRKIYTEVYKKDENFTFLHLGFIKFRICWKYNADEDGNILKRKAKVEIWNRSGCGWCLYKSGICMLFFCFNEMKHIIERINKNPTNHIIDFMREFDQEWDKRWWKKLYVFIIKIKYKNLKNFLNAQQLLRGENIC